MTAKPQNTCLKPIFVRLSPHEAAWGTSDAIFHAVFYRLRLYHRMGKNTRTARRFSRYGRTEFYSRLVKRQAG